MSGVAQALVNEYLKVANFWRKNAENAYHVPQYSQDGITQVDGIPTQPSTHTTKTTTESSKESSSRKDARQDDNGGASGIPSGSQRICPACGRTISDSRPCQCGTTKPASQSQGDGAGTTGIPSWFWPAIVLGGVAIGAAGAAVTAWLLPESQPAEQGYRESSLQYLEDRGGHLSP